MNASPQNFHPRVGLPLDLSPARWMWLPCGRTLPNTLVCFRRKFFLSSTHAAANGWILADSRYRLWVNGTRVQWGPSPADPRSPEADPIELRHLLRPGENVIAVEVLFFGHGDGTWATGNPGLIVHLTARDGTLEIPLHSGPEWQCALARTHRPGQYAQWFLRALQEVVDARGEWPGWKLPGFIENSEWITPEMLEIPSNKPTVFAHPGSQEGPGAENPAALQIEQRSVPMLREEIIQADGPCEEGRTSWPHDPEDWFACRVKGSLLAERSPVSTRTTQGVQVPATAAKSGSFLTYVLSEQAVGWPLVTLEATAGTIVEVMLQESHDPGGPAFLETHRHSWFRWTCREGVQTLEPFDFFAMRWIQIHIRNASGPVTVHSVTLRRRLFPWPAPPRLKIGHPALQRLADAASNTLNNSVQETICDGFGRERQQYSGDCGHQLHAVRMLAGAKDAAARFLWTWSRGQAKEGWFLDCWPGVDRLQRIAQRHLGLTCWGPILDHAIGFAFDCHNHRLESEDEDMLRTILPRLLRFADWLWAQRDPEGMLPADGYGIPSVWLDHSGFHMTRHKRLPFTLYAAGMYRHALAPWLEGAERETCLRRSDELVSTAQRLHWCPKRERFFDNLPWETQEGGPRCHDRTLAMAVLFDQCPNQSIAGCVASLAECPREMGFSYPANAGWRLWALAKANRIDVVLNDLEHRWSTLRSVRENRTISEDWEPLPDSTAQWSHCAVVPLYILAQCVAGIQSVAPGFQCCTIRPQLADLASLELSVQTPQGPIHFNSKLEREAHRVRIEVPQGIDTEWISTHGALALAPGRHELYVPASLG